MSDDKKKWQRLKELLDETTEWPIIYAFKFIVPQKSFETLRALIGSDVEVRPSSGGKYMGVTLRQLVDSSDAVIAVYESVAVVDGLIAL